MARPTEPLNVSLRINCGDRMTSCQPHATNSTEVEAIVMVMVMGDALEYTIDTGGVVVVAVAGDMMRNILQIKISTI